MARNRRLAPGLVLCLALVTACQDQPARVVTIAAEAGPGQPADAQPAARVSAPADSLAGTLRLPATYTGVLPCADCPGIRHHLDLWPDGVFHLRQTYLGEDAAFAEVGLWRRDPLRAVIWLHGDREAPRALAVTGPATLRLLGVDGQPIASELNYELTTAGRLDPAEITLSLVGRFRYYADAARLEICRTGRSYPVAMEGASLDLERAYLAADPPEPAAPVTVRIAASLQLRPPMEGDGLVPTVVVEEFLGLQPDTACAGALAAVGLADQLWRLQTLRGERLPDAADGGEPSLILAGHAGVYHATVGCNRLRGTYAVSGPEITFAPGAATRMACPPPLDALERELNGVLARARGWAISGRMLTLTGPAEQPLATAEAVILR